jgi:hypothetical protein
MHWPAIELRLDIGGGMEKHIGISAFHISADAEWLFL